MKTLDLQQLKELFPDADEDTLISAGILAMVNLKHVTSSTEQLANFLIDRLSNTNPCNWRNDVEPSPSLAHKFNIEPGEYEFYLLGALEKYLVYYEQDLNNRQGHPEGQFAD